MPWINEFHYDNAGTDAGEFIEIAGLAGTDLTGYSLVLYNGNPSQRTSYNTMALSGIIPDQQNGYGTISFGYPANGIQNGGSGSNGEPDGVALVGPSGVIEFISYEGSFVAANGPAAGMTSTNVGDGIFEAGNVSGTSIGRVGTGTQASDFTWAVIDDDTPGAANVGQTFPAPAVPWVNEFHYDNAGTDAGEFIEIAGAAGLDLTGYQLVLYNGNPSQRTAYSTMTLSGTIANQQNGFGTLSFAYPVNGIQNGGSGGSNGEPDGIALVRPDGTVIEFLSYEGSFVAANGPAAGMTSINVGEGVYEPGNVNGTSIGRVGTGTQAGDFTWAVIDDDTPGTTNVGQTFGTSSGQPSISIDDVSIAEGDSGTTNAVFTVTLSQASTSAVTVAFSTADGSAAAGSDYVATSGTLTFAPGQTSQTITVAITGDTAIEADESFSVILSSPTNATIGDGEGLGTILNDDSTPPPAGAAPFINEFHYDNTSTDVGEFIEIAGAAGLNLSGYSLVLYNGNGGGSYDTIALSGIIPDQQNGYGTVTFAAPGLQNGSPDGIALVGPSGVLEFISYEGAFTASNGPASGMTSVDVGVEESGNANGTSIGRVGTGNQPSDFTWALIGDDSPGGVNDGQTFAAAVPTVSVNDVSVVEGNDGLTYATFTITRTGPGDAFSVAYATADGTATAGSDYDATSGVLNFAAGQTQATVSVAVHGDTIAEADESFFLNLSDATGGATIADAQGRGTILNDDGLPPTVAIDDVALNEGNEGTTQFTFTVTRSGGTGAFSVDYITTGGTATVGSDYALASGTLAFGEGETSKTITVDVFGDYMSEPNETFEVHLFNPTDSAVIADGTGVGTIVNDDLTLIHDIQGTSYFSPILASEGIHAFNVASSTVVTIQAVVTAVDGEGSRQGFYITEEDWEWDDNAFSSEGLFVMTRDDSGNGVTLDSITPDGLQVGDVVTLSAHVMEYQAFSNLPRTVLTGVTSLTRESTGNPLPIMFLDASRPIPNEILTGVTPDYFDSSDDAGDTFDGANYALSYFESVEGMLVMMPDMVAADGFVSSSGGQPFFKAYSTVHANADQINSRGGYTIAGDPPLSPPDTAETTGDDTHFGGRHLHDGDVNPDIVELDFTDFAVDAFAGLAENLSMGDRLGDVYGIIDFDFTDLKLFVSYIDQNAFVDTQPVQEVTALQGDSQTLTVATFNVENLDPGDGAARFTQIANVIATNLKAPDIISIEEIQDNNGAAGGDGTSSTGADASTTWTMLVNAVNLATGGHYQWVDQAPVYNAEGGEQSGNIRVGFLYNTDRVQLGDLAADASLAERRQFTDRIGDGVRDAGDRILFSDNMLGSEINTSDWSNTRKSLLGQFSFNGETVFVMANHLPSKGGSGQFWQIDQTLESGAPANAGWEKRAAIGQDVYSMLNLVQNGAPSAGVVAGGDFNDFYFYRPLEAATGYVYANGSARSDGAKLTNLTLTLDEAERYTYDFDGRSQAIDHILVNDRLAGIASYDVVHINTGYNALGNDPSISDHDPAVAAFFFGSAAQVLDDAPTPIVFEELPIGEIMYDLPLFRGVMLQAIAAPTMQMGDVYHTQIV